MSELDLTVPEFLSVKNPTNIAIRARQKEQIRPVAPKAKFGSVTPAKSVATDPTRPRPSMPAKAGKSRPSPPETNTPMAKTAGAGKPSRSSRINPASVIRVLATEFGHKPGSKAETKSNAFRDGMTVEEYMADDLGFAGKWHSGHIKHCLDKGFIKLED